MLVAPGKLFYRPDLQGPSMSTLFVISGELHVFDSFRRIVSGYRRCASVMLSTRTCAQNEKLEGETLSP